MAMKYVRFDDTVRCIPVTPTTSETHDFSDQEDAEKQPVVNHENDADRLDMVVHRMTGLYAVLLSAVTVSIVLTIAYSIFVLVSFRQTSRLLLRIFLIACLMTFMLMQVIAGWFGVYGSSRYFLHIDMTMQSILLVLNVVLMVFRLVPTIICLILLSLQSVILLVCFSLCRRLKRQENLRS